MRREIAHVALPVHREHHPPAIRRERDGTLLGGTLGEPETGAVVRDHLAHRRDPLAVLAGLAQVVLQLALEVGGRRVGPRRELELGLGQGEDRAERGDRLLVAEYRRDDLALVDPERALARGPPQVELAGLLRVG